MSILYFRNVCGVKGGRFYAQKLKNACTNLFGNLLLFIVFNNFLLFLIISVRITIFWTDTFHSSGIALPFIFKETDTMSPNSITSPISVI